MELTQGKLRALHLKEASRINPTPQERDGSLRSERRIPELYPQGDRRKSITNLLAAAKAALKEMESWEEDAEFATGAAVAIQLRAAIAQIERIDGNGAAA